MKLKFLEMIIYLYIACMIAGCGVIPEQITWNVSNGEVAWVIKRAMSMRPESFLMMKNNTIAFFAFVKDVGWMGTMVSEGMNPSDFKLSVTGIPDEELKKFSTYMFEKGWNLITPYDIPIKMRIMLSQASWLESLAGKMPFLLFVPLGNINLLEIFEVNL